MKKISKKTYLLAAILSFFVFGTAGISHAQEAPKSAKSEVKATSTRRMRQPKKKGKN